MLSVRIFSLHMFLKKSFFSFILKLKYITKVSEKIIDRFLKYLQQTKMTVWQRANPIIQQVSFIIVRAKGNFILFDGVELMFNPLNANPEKWSNILKQIVGNLPTICLSVFDHFMNLALKGLNDRILCMVCLMPYVFFDYGLLHSPCILHFFFL